MTNTDEKAAAFLARLIRLENEKRENAEDRKEVLTEMKSAHLLEEEIDGVKLAVKLHFMTEKKLAKRESAEQFAKSLGPLRDTALGVAAVERAYRGIAKAGGGTISSGGEVLLTIPGVAAAHA